MTDAVLETKKIALTAAKMAGEDYTPSKERYTFEYPGSTQGFLKCEYHTLDAAGVRILKCQAKTGCASSVRMWQRE